MLTVTEGCEQPDACSFLGFFLLISHERAFHGSLGQIETEGQVMFCTVKSM